MGIFDVVGGGYLVMRINIYRATYNERKHVLVALICVLLYVAHWFLRRPKPLEVPNLRGRTEYTAIYNM